MKKISVYLFALVFFIATLLMPVGSVFADGGGGNSKTGVNCDSHFMGLQAWYDGVKEICNGEQPADQFAVREMIWRIVINIAIMVLQIVGYICVGFVIWGGYLYMLSRGDSGKVANGKKTMTRALIGLVICMTASLISGAIVDIASGAAAENDRFFVEIFNTAFLWAGIVCAIIIVIGGISYVTSTGDSQRTTKAKSTIMNAAIGLAITLLAAAIVNLVVNAVNG